MSAGGAGSEWLFYPNSNPLADSYGELFYSSGNLLAKSNWLYYDLIQYDGGSPPFKVNMPLADGAGNIYWGFLSNPKSGRGNIAILADNAGNLHSSLGVLMADCNGLLASAIGGTISTNNLPMDQLGGGGAVTNFNDTIFLKSGVVSNTLTLGGTNVAVVGGPVAASTLTGIPPVYLASLTGQSNMIVSIYMTNWAASIVTAAAGSTLLVNQTWGYISNTVAGLFKVTVMGQMTGATPQAILTNRVPAAVLNGASGVFKIQSGECFLQLPANCGISISNITTISFQTNGWWPCQGGSSFTVQQIQ